MDLYCMAKEKKGLEHCLLGADCRHRISRSKMRNERVKSLVVEALVK